MSDLFVDVAIWILLFIGIGFGGIAVMGLFLFPDVRSRLYTAERASLISSGAIGASVLVYAFHSLAVTGAGQYSVLAVHTVFLCLVILFANIVVAKITRQRTRGLSLVHGSGFPATEPVDRK